MGSRKSHTVIPRIRARAIGSLIFLPLHWLCTALNGARAGVVGAEEAALGGVDSTLGRAGPSVRVDDLR